MQGWLLYAIPILFATSVFLFAWSLIPEKSDLSRQLDALKSRDAMEREAGRLAPFERMFNEERRAVLKRKLAEAGWYTVTPAKMGLRIVSGAGFGIMLGLIIWKFAPGSPVLIMFLAIMVAVAGAYSPLYFLNQAIEARKVAIQKALPDFLDMVSSTVQAGLAVNAALAHAVDAAPGPLGEEIKEALSQIRLGRGRAEALKAAAERTNQQSFKTAILAITQAEKLGSNVAKVLEELADDSRNQRVMLVEEAAAKLPVKMVFPMAFFMLPSIFLVIFGTIIANYLANSK
jgi:tight adherence protein C